MIVTVSFLSHPLDSVFAAHSGNPATRTCVQREEHLDVVQTQLHHQVNKNQSLYHLVTFLLSLSSWILDNKGSVASCYKSHKRTLLWLRGANFPAQTTKHYWLYCQHCSFANRSGIYTVFYGALELAQMQMAQGFHSGGGGRVQMWPKNGNSAFSKELKGGRRGWRD